MAAAPLPVTGSGAARPAIRGVMDRRPRPARGGALPRAGVALKASAAPTAYLRVPTLEKSKAFCEPTRSVPRGWCNIRVGQVGAAGGHAPPCLGWPGRSPGPPGPPSALPVPEGGSASRVRWSAGAGASSSPSSTHGWAQAVRRKARRPRLRRRGRRRGLGDDPIHLGG